MNYATLALWVSRFQPLTPLRRWLDQLDIYNPRTASLITQLIPAQCPFARTLRIGGRTILKIPPLCKLNPLFDELMHLRFRALCYLAETEQLNESV